MANNITIGQALNALAPNCNFGVGDEDIIAKQAELQVEYDAKQYQRDREIKYPSWQDQMDMQYHDQVNGTTTWKDAIKAIKDANPKG